MAATATVTAKVADLTGNHRPELQPLVIISLEKPGITTDGTVVPPEPTPMIDDGNGNLSLELIVTDEFLEQLPYTVTIDWLSLSGEVSLREQGRKIFVPDSGGPLDQLIGPDFAGWWNQRVVWVGLTEPRLKTRGMLWLLSDPADPDNADVSHPSWDSSWKSGDLLEWS